MEVVDHDGQPPDERQRRLLVTFLRGQPTTDRFDTFVIAGGERVRNIVVEQVAPTAAAPKCLELLVDRAGDFSFYTLRSGRPGHRWPVTAGL
ncbi:MAG: hypothetical protein R2867_26230 [Caldilineaceae bacterium]